MTNKKPIPVAPENTDVNLDDLKWMLFWERHRKSIIGGSIAFIVIAIVVGIYFFVDIQRSLSAQAAFAKASDKAAWEEIVKDYPGTVTAGNALLLIAKAQRLEGKLDASTTTYQLMLDKYAKHPLVTVAALGIASNKADAGELQAADQAYQQAAATYGSTFIAPLALFNEAQLLLSQGKQKETLPILENIVVQYPESIMSNAASSLAGQLHALDLDRSAAQQPSSTQMATP